jgi:hypothetical protein
MAASTKDRPRTAGKITWRKRCHKDGSAHFHGAFPGGFDTMLIDYRPARRRPWGVPYRPDLRSRRETNRSFVTCAEAVAFAKSQARLNVLDCVLGAHEALKALA